MGSSSITYHTVIDDFYAVDEFFQCKNAPCNSLRSTGLNLLLGGHQDNLSGEWILWKIEGCIKILGIRSHIELIPKIIVNCNTFANKYTSCRFAWDNCCLYLSVEAVFTLPIYTLFNSFIKWQVWNIFRELITYIHFADRCYTNVLSYTNHILFL